MRAAHYSIHQPAKPSSGCEVRPDLIEVAVALPLFNTFTYQVPAELMPAVQVGSRVLVPFGGRRVTGYVLKAGCAPPQAPLKMVSALLDETALFPTQMIPFFRWIAEYYIHPLGQVLQSALPAGINVSEQITYALSEEGRCELVRQSLTGWRGTLFERLQQGPCRLSVLRHLTGSSLLISLLKTWEQNQWVLRQESLAGGRTRPKTARFVVPAAAAGHGIRLSDARRSVLALVQERGAISLQELRTLIPSAGRLVHQMAADGQVEFEQRSVYRDPLGAPILPDAPPVLNPEQQGACDSLNAALGKGYRTFLLAGVTGSGKTEVYLRMAQKALQENMRVLVLVPEIALVTQMERAFRARFGQGVALLHSGLSEGERLDQWMRIRQGRSAVAIGARSAIFAPFERLGLIVVDEEHDDSYKQEGDLHYNARDLAVVRARQQGAVAILGSATPSLQSAYNALQGKFHKVSLFERVDHRSLPRVEVKDLSVLREERGMRRYLTADLIEAMRQALARQEQVLLFLNRRGFANLLICGACGQPLHCSHCDISLTYHRRSNAYTCHYCGFTCAAAARCSKCGSERIKRLGLGTEQVEEQVQNLFPGARVARMDRDSTRRRGALLKILKDLRERKIDILVGTQMVAKGHDYPFITLVGIICADLSLSLPDFRAGERTFQILAQVAGRAGRGELPGRVILQTYNPGHFSIAAAQAQDYEMFYRQEIQFRKALGYPPLTRMVQIRISGRDRAKIAACACALAQAGQSLQRRESYTGLELLGPLEAPLPRIADHYRWQLLLKHPRADVLHRFVRRLLFGTQAPPIDRHLRIAVDVDPVFLM